MHVKKIPKKRYIFPEQRRETIDKLRLNSVIMEYQKVVEATGDLAGNKIANKITAVSKKFLIK